VLYTAAIEVQANANIVIAYCVEVRGCGTGILYEVKLETCWNRRAGHAGNQQQTKYRK
jgi:hypothetical protein